MIFDNIVNRATYQDMPQLKQVLAYMASISVDNFPTESYQIMKDELFVNPVSLMTKSEAECLFEAHRRYIDVHYILEGAERIVVATPDKLTVTIPFDVEKDIGFYQGEGKVECTLKAGDFLVCFPHDAHKVAIMESTPAQVKKLVGKILVAQL